MLGFIAGSTGLLTYIGALAGFIATFILLYSFKDKLPTDIGRAFAVNAAAAKGKPRGAGIIFVPAFVLISLACTPFSVEYLIYCVLMLAAMMSGYLDDASRAPWGELKKGLIDLAISLAGALTYVICNGSELTFIYIGKTVTLPAWLYVLLGTILIWVSINVTNCTDGVDGLSSTLTLISLAGFIALDGLTGHTGLMPASYVLAGCLGAYLIFNCSPSILLMGDAGSRTIGLFFALAAMKSGSPLMFLPICLIFILDGGLGLLKVSLLRYLKIKIMKNVRTPLHDHFRKNLGWSDTHVVIRFAVVHAVIIFASVYII